MNKPLNRDAIKYIAMVTMLLNHIANIFIPTGVWIGEVFISVGYFTAITMLYFLVEGYEYTHSKKKYLARLLIFGLISEIPYCIALTNEGIISFRGFDMIFTLALCFGLIWFLDTHEKKWMKFLASVVAVVLSVFCDWALMAPIITLLFIWSKHSEKKIRIAYLLSAALFGILSFLGGMEHFSFVQNVIFAVLAMMGMVASGICILHLYNGKRAEKGKTFSKWFFYLFYPAHLLVLGIIRISLL